MLLGLLRMVIQRRIKFINMGQNQNVQRMDSNLDQKIRQLRLELELGEQSGMVSDFNPKKYLEDLKKKHIR